MDTNENSDTYEYKDADKDMAVARQTLRAGSFRYLKDQNNFEKLMVTLLLNQQHFEKKLADLEKRTRCKVI